MSKSENLTKATLQGTVWEFSSKYSGKILAFITTIILARLLLKEDFGLAGYALVAIGFLEILEGLGIGPAVIYHHKDERRLDSAFWLGLGIGVVLFGLTWLLVAPLAGAFFNEPRVVPMTRALGAEFLISAFAIVPAALLTKRLAFGRKFVPDISRSVGKGVVSIVFALLGFGAWSLIIGQLSGVIMQTITYWIVVPWRPRLRFQRDMASSLLSYGSRIASIDILGLLLLNIDYLLIGRFMGAAALGVYTLGFRIPDLLIKQLCTIVGRVTFPVYTKLRDDLPALRQSLLVTMRYVTMLTIPLGLGLALVAGPFVLTFFSDKWAEAIPVMSAIAIYMLLRSLEFNLGGIYKATGRPGLLSKLNFFQAMVAIPVLWWTAVTYESIVVIAWTQVVLAFFASLIKMVTAARLVHIPLTELFRTFVPSLLGGAVMALAVVSVSRLLTDTVPVVQLMIEVAVGFLVYCLMLFLLQRDDVMRAGMMVRTVFLPKTSRA